MKNAILFILLICGITAAKAQSISITNQSGHAVTVLIGVSEGGTRISNFTNPITIPAASSYYMSLSTISNASWLMSPSPGNGAQFVMVHVSETCSASMCNYSGCACNTYNATRVGDPNFGMIANSCYYVSCNGVGGSMYINFDNSNFPAQSVTIN